MIFQKFYKVIILKCDLFESMIVDERHFKTKHEANKYAVTHNNDKNVAVVVAV